MRNFFAVIFVLIRMTNGMSQESTDPKATEVWEPEPKVVTPGNNSAPPSDAIILFDGRAWKIG